MNEVELIVHATAHALGVPADLIVGRMRHAKVARARHIAMFVAREDTFATLTEIGHAFGRDHTTVRAGVAKVIDLVCASDEGALRDVAAVRVRMLGAKKVGLIARKLAEVGT